MPVLFARFSRRDVAYLPESERTRTSCLADLGLNDLGEQTPLEKTLADRAIDVQTVEFGAGKFPT